MPRLGPYLAMSWKAHGRRPGATALSVAALAAVTCSLSIPLLIDRCLLARAEGELALAPSLLIERAEPDEGAPIPSEPTLAALRSIRGVWRVEGRRNGRALADEAGSFDEVALWTNTEDEARAIAPEIVEALPWPISATTRAERLRVRRHSIALGAGRETAHHLAVLLALLLLAHVNASSSMRPGEAALRKALGWTSTEIAHQGIVEALIVLVPSLLIGLVVAVALVLAPASLALLELYGVPPEAQPLLPWMSSESWLVVLLELLRLVALPWLVTSLWPALRQSASNPAAALFGVTRGGPR